MKTATIYLIDSEKDIVTQVVISTKEKAHKPKRFMKYEGVVYEQQKMPTISYLRKCYPPNQKFKYKQYYYKKVS